jgi:hypothetical protein
MQIRDSRKERFGFLEFSIGVVKAKQSGKLFPLVEPSDKALQSLKQKIKFYTRRDMNPVPIESINGSGLVLNTKESLLGAGPEMLTALCIAPVPSYTHHA